MDKTGHITAYQAHVAQLARSWQHALDKHGLSAVVVHSGSLQKKLRVDDQYWPLRVVPAFAHWCPLQWPDAAILVMHGQRPRLLAWEDRSFWERWARPDFAFMESALDVEHVADPADVKHHLPAGRVAFIGEDHARAESWGVAPEWFNPPALVDDLDELRVTKSRYEQMCLAEANRIAALGHARVASEFHAGMRSELQLHLAYLSATDQDDPDTPYKNIMAVGASAAILHHVSYSRSAPAGPASLLVDAGATFHGYASDITRTHATGGSAEADAFRQLVNRLDNIQLQLCARALPGRNYQDLHDEAHVLLAGLLRESHLVDMPVDAMVQAGVTRLLLPHGLGHSLGLQTHDVACARIKPRADNRFLRNTRNIEPGQCFTIEPGVYFIDTFMDELRAGPHGAHVDWKLVDALRPFGGIRIEDDLVVHAGSHPPENLTRAHLQ